MKKYQIFISSTFTDLIDERQAAVEAILQTGHIPAGMELFAASNKSQWEIIKKWIDESDIYMLILGGRYGSIEPDSGLSYTELEYKYACEIGKPLFALVLDENFIEQKVQKQGSKNIRELNEPQKLKVFSNNVLSKLCKICHDSKDIQLGVFQSISSLERDNKLTGWVKASEIIDSKQFMDQITALQREKEKLLKENESLQKQINSLKKEDDHEFQKLKTILSSKEISLKSVPQTDENMPDTAPILNVFSALKNQIILGVTNELNMDAWDKFIFFKLAPELQIHGLMQLEKITGAKARRFIITKEGQKFLQYLEFSKNKIAATQ